MTWLVAEAVVSDAKDVREDVAESDFGCKLALAESAFTFPAALDNAVDTEAGIIQRLAPTLEHNEWANEVATRTSEPEQDMAIQPATCPDHWGIIHKQPVSQYGHGVLPVERSGQSAAQEGSSDLMGSAKPLILAVLGTAGYVDQLSAATKFTKIDI